MGLADWYYGMILDCDLSIRLTRAPRFRKKFHPKYLWVALMRTVFLQCFLAFGLGCDGQSVIKNALKMYRRHLKQLLVQLWTSGKSSKSAFIFMCGGSLVSKKVLPETWEKLFQCIVTKFDKISTTWAMSKLCCTCDKTTLSTIRTMRNSLNKK